MFGVFTAGFSGEKIKHSTPLRDSSCRKIPWLARATEEREGEGIDSRLEKTAIRFYQ